MMIFPPGVPAASSVVDLHSDSRTTDTEFSNAMMTKGAGRAGAMFLPGRDAERRVADRIYMRCFGGGEDALIDAVRRSFELPSRRIHLDAAILAMARTYRDELADMRDRHSDEELRDIARAGAEVALRVLRRGDVTGFLAQFEANIFAAMNRKSGEILRDREIAGSGGIMGPDRPFPECNPDSRHGLTGDGPDMSQGGWQPGTMRFDPMPGMPDDFMQNGPSLSFPPGGPQAEPEAPQTQTSSRPSGTPRTTFMEEAARSSLRRHFERMEEAAREAIGRSLGNSPFVTGADPITQAIEEHGPLIELFLHALVAQVTPGPTGGTPTLPAPSSATANVLRHLPPAVAAAIVHQIGSRMSDVPQIYRDALAQALAKGDPQNNHVQQAIKLIDAAARGVSGGESPTEDPPLSADEAAFLNSQIERGRLTIEQFTHFRALNPDLLVTILIHRIGRFNAGEDVEGLRFSDADPILETDPAADIAPPADLVHSWDDIRTVLHERYGMRLSDGSIHAAQRRLTRHSEAEMCALINAAIPYLDRMEAAHPGLLRGISIDVHSPNPRGLGPNMPGRHNGMTNIANGTIYLMTPHDMRIAYQDRPIDGDTKFMLTLFHEIGHAIASKAPGQANDFMRNLIPVLEIGGPESTAAGPDAMSMDEALATLFPHLDIERAYERLWQHYFVRIDDTELMEMEAEGREPPARQDYFGTLQVYRKAPVDICAVLEICVSGYAGTNPQEALAESFAHDFADRPYQRYPDEQLPRLVEAMRGPLPANLQSLLARMIYVAQRRDQPVGAPPYPEFQEGGE
jgi:hypothetical protein